MFHFNILYAPQLSGASRSIIITESAFCNKSHQNYYFFPEFNVHTIFNARTCICLSFLSVFAFGKGLYFQIKTLHFNNKTQFTKVSSTSHKTISYFHNFDFVIFQDASSCLDLAIKEASLLFQFLSVPLCYSIQSLHNFELMAF